MYGYIQGVHTPVCMCYRITEYVMHLVHLVVAGGTASYQMTNPGAGGGGRDVN